MLEMLLGGSRGIYISWSGPGSKIVRHGNEESGFFDFVPDPEVISAFDLLDQTDTQFTRPASVSFDWLKFIYQNRVYFIPDRFIFSEAVSWLDLYKQGLVGEVNASDYGSELITALGDAKVRAPQYITNGKYWFSLKLIEYSEDELFEGYVIGPETGTSEVRDTLMRIFSRYENITQVPTLTYLDGRVVYDSAFLTNTPYLDGVVYLNSHTQLQNLNRSSLTEKRQWLPVLVLETEALDIMLSDYRLRSAYIPHIGYPVNTTLERYAYPHLVVRDCQVEGLDFDTTILSHTRLRNTHQLPKFPPSAVTLRNEDRITFKPLSIDVSFSDLTGDPARRDIHHKGSLDYGLRPLYPRALPMKVGIDNPLSFLVVAEDVTGLYRNGHHHNSLRNYIQVPLPSFRSFEDSLLRMNSVKGECLDEESVHRNRLFGSSTGKTIGPSPGKYYFYCGTRPRVMHFDRDHSKRSYSAYGYRYKYEGRSLLPPYTKTIPNVKTLLIDKFDAEILNED